MGVKKQLVSIIMNCYNSDRFLREAIESVYKQTYPNWEIIFWDNASTDDSANIAKSYDDRIKYHLAPETTPLGEARNLALKKASGEYIAFLDCDDVYMADKLEQQVGLMQSKGYVMCYGSVAIIDENGKLIKKDIVKIKVVMYFLAC
jgi:glycosyltransferase involved in cell wall biosynthesis